MPRKLNPLTVLLFCLWGMPLSNPILGADVSSPKPWSASPVGHPTFVSPQSTPIVIDKGLVYVANTPADTVDVIDTQTQELECRIHVGVDPVSIAVRPDGKEVWVSNHISDSVSVIDSDPSSVTYLQVVATVQEFDAATKATRFDEPVGIAFASNAKAYVALSSENRIAVVNVASRRVEKRLKISAQDPRCLVVRGDRLYVIPFESNNQTQLSGGYGELDDDLVTFNAHEHAIANNNVLSVGAVMDIVKHPRVPDRDLYVFDTTTDKLIETVETLGTLLYGMTVDAKGRVYIAQTDARNEVNGRAGTKKHGLAELENRAFLNRITRIDLGGDSQEPRFFDLEPIPPNQPEPERALATPFAIQLTDDDSTLVVTAAGSDTLFTVDADSGEVLGRVGVDAVPRGIALQHSTRGELQQAWVLNAVANSVSLVDLSSVDKPKLVDTIELDDPTHPAVKRGRTAFNTASASTTKTFACASCHPDGHTDQLLWVLKTPVVTGGNQIMPRSTMPIRGLRDTAPYHWDGIPGDPYGGNNSANVHGSDEPNSRLDDPRSTTRHLIDGGLAATMSLVGSMTENDEGKAGALSAAERDDMATFLLSVPYPPAQRRAYTNVVSRRAEEGFELFHIHGDHQDDPTPNVCGNCHRMPFWVSTNTPGSGMDAPTWRGAYDRFLILPQGRLNIIDFDFYREIAERGIPERRMWQFSWAGRRRFDPVWDMVLEGSTGYSGSFARQVTLNQETVNSDLAVDLLDALELSAREEAVVLEGEGVLIEDGKPTEIALQYDGRSYRCKSENIAFERKQLVEMAKNGQFVGTITARHGAEASVDHPQPAIWTLGPIEQQRGRQEFPILHPQSTGMTVSGRHVSEGAFVVVDGRRSPATVSVDDADELVRVQLTDLPAVGMHLLQLQNPDGMFSNDFIFHAVENADAAVELKRAFDREHVNPRDAFGQAVANADMDEIKLQLANGAEIDEQRPDGSTPLNTAVLHGHMEVAQLLIREGADVDATNRDGNTSMHVGAFLCRTDLVKLLLNHGASLEVENRREETPIDVVLSPWSDGLAGFYAGIGRSIGQEFDLDHMEQDRTNMAKLLQKHAGSLGADEAKEP